MTRLDITEKDFQKNIVDYARMRGWKVQHSRKTTIARTDGTIRHATAITGHVGYPDLTMVRRGQVAFLEVKTERGTVSDEQVIWLNALSGVYPGTELWRSKGAVPDGAAILPGDGKPSLLESAGDYWITLVAVVRPRHWEWIVEVMK